MEKIDIAYKDSCQFINVEVSSGDPNKAKAFVNSTNGTVLGVQFYTKT
jgi:capsular polysaccharide biosynthesis protein